jgi:hypothetical protein
MAREREQPFLNCYGLESSLKPEAVRQHQRNRPRRHCSRRSRAWQTNRLLSCANQTPTRQQLNAWQRHDDADDEHGLHRHDDGPQPP